MTQGLGKAKKADLPGVYEEFEGHFIGLLNEAIFESSVASTSHLTVKQAGVETEFPEKSHASGAAGPGQVKVGVTMGITKNLGNFNSARYDCFTETYAEDTPEGFARGLERANMQAETALRARQEELAEYLKKTEEE